MFASLGNSHNRGIVLSEYWWAAARNRDSKAADESNLNRCHLFGQAQEGERRALPPRSFETTPRIICEQEQENLEGNTKKIGDVCSSDH